MRLTLSQPRSTVIVFQFTHPVWGATCWLLYKHKYQMCFNSRTPCGVRPQSDCLYLLQRQCFNSRTPCGVRLYSSSRYASAVCFNSRTPCGVRLNSNISCMSRLMFQFTHPVWGATSKYVTKQFRNVFQFTHPVWGATLLSLGPLRSPLVSIHAPRVGCDTSFEVGAMAFAVSIHAPRVGCDWAG